MRDLESPPDTVYTTVALGGTKNKALTRPHTVPKYALIKMHHFGGVGLAAKRSIGAP